MPIQELIAQNADRLTPSERRIAEAILKDPTLLAFGTVSDLADRMGTSGPTVVRFAAKLGFAGFTDLQRWTQTHFADQLAGRIATPSQRIRAQSTDHTTDHTTEHDSAAEAVQNAVRRTLDAFTQERLARLAAPVASARAVWIVSGETSRAGAVVLNSGLAMLRDAVRLVEHHDMGRDLSAAGPTDAAVVIDFARYRADALVAANLLADRGAHLIAITDGPLSPLVPIADQWCEVKVPAVGPFDSSLPAVLAAELLVREVARQLGPPARERIDRLEQLWTETGTFLPER